MTEKDTPKIQVDSDWKAQAQAEKQKLAEQSKATASGGSASAAGKATAPSAGRTAGGIPPASFETLLSTMVTQALFAMGAIPDPSTGQRIQHLDLARHHIDMLGVIEEKTKGNLTEEESSLLVSTLYELRSRYIQMSTAARRV